MTDQTKELYGKNIYAPIEEVLLFRPLSRRIAHVLAPTGVSPDSVSAIGLLTTVFAGSLFWIGVPNRQIIVPVLLYFALLVDKTDGDLARLKGTAGTKGQYVDGFLDQIGEIFLTISIAMGVGLNDPLLIGLSVAGPMLFNYHGVSAPLYLGIPPATHLRGENKTPIDYVREFFSYGRAKHFLLFIAAILFGAPGIVFFILPILLPYTFGIFAKNFLAHARRA